jgi:hypothetical protein
MHMLALHLNWFTVAGLFTEIVKGQISLFTNQGM